MGFAGGSKRESELNQWINAEKEQLAAVMERHGIEWEHAAETAHLFERDAAPCFPFAQELTFCFATVADGSFPGYTLFLTSKRIFSKLSGNLKFSGKL